MSNQNSSLQNRRRGTLIVVRRMLTVPKTALAGVGLEISFARFTTSMAASNKERTSSRRFCRLESFSMVGARDGWEKRGRRPGCAEGPNPNNMIGHSAVTHLVLDGENFISSEVFWVSGV